MDNTKKEYVIIGENDSEDWDILSNWSLKANQTNNELREHALNKFCLTLDHANEIISTDNYDYISDHSDYETVKIIHIDEMLERIGKN